MSLFKRTALALLVAFLTAAPLSAATLTLADYLLYSSQGDVFLGISSDMFGNVGAGDDFNTNGGATVTGDVNAGDVAQLGNNVHVSGTVTNQGTFTTSGSATFGAHVDASPTFPLLPPISSITTGAVGFTMLGNNFSIAPSPGQYAAISGGGSGEIHLTSGTYTFTNIATANGLDLYFDLSGGPIRILVTGNFTTGNSLNIILVNGGTANDIYLEAQGSSNEFAFSAAGGSEWLGTVYTPNAGIHFGSGSTASSFQGHFWAKGYIDIEHSVTGTMPPPVVPEPATLLLTGIGLGALAVRRRRAARLNQ